MATHYFLGTRLLATCPAKPMWDDIRPSEVSVMFVCPTCGDIWGRIILDGAEWLPLRRGCAKHPWPNYTTGSSFIAGWRLGCPEELPPEVLQYETSIRLQQEPQ